MTTVRITVLRDNAVQVVRQPTVLRVGVTTTTGPPGPAGANGAGIHVGPTPPTDTSLLWVNTA